MVGKRSKKLITAQRHYHTCPKCSLMDLCRTDSIHRCKGCGNIWAGAIKQPLPKISVSRRVGCETNHRPGLRSCSGASREASHDG